MKNKAFLILGLLLLMNTSYSLVETDDYFETSTFYRGDVLFELEKDTYAAGEEVKTDFTIANMENFPIIDAYLVIEVVEGELGQEPTQVSDTDNTIQEENTSSLNLTALGELWSSDVEPEDTDNIIYEEKITGINLPALGKKTVAFSYKLPTDLKAGAYRLEAYFLTERTSIVGIPTIMLSPQHRGFTVTGAGSFPQARIVRNKTVFQDALGQMGPSVKPESTVSGRVYISNEGDAAGCVLTVSVCAWDDTSCTGDALIWTKDYEVSLKPKSTETVSVEFTAPKKTDAYAIRLELKDNEGRTMSLYRSRIVVAGETAKIRKLAISKAYYRKDETATVKILAGASPDPENSVSVKNAKLTAYVDAGGKTVYTESRTLPELSAATKGLLAEEFVFSAPEELAEFTVCAKTESEKGEPYDEYCYTVTPEKNMLTENVINTEWSYDEEKSSLDIELCSEDVSGIATEASAAALLMDAENELVEARDGLSLKPCTTASFTVDGGEYLLLVNDLGTNKQTTTKISIEVKEQPAVCGNGICESGESSGTCCVDCGCAAGMKCLSGKCMPEPKQDNTLIYAILALAVIALAALFLRRKKK